MANDVKRIINTQGLQQYDQRLKSYLKDKLTPATETKRGLVKISDFPCYSSNLEVKWDNTITTGEHKEITEDHDYGDEYGLSFDFLSLAADGIDMINVYEPDNVTYPTYTVIVDGKAYSGCVVRAWSSGDANEFMNIFALDEDHLPFCIQFNGPDLGITGTPCESRFEVWTDEIGAGVTHNLQVYKEVQTEIVHKLDSKYLTMSNSISSGDTGLVTGDQVYNYIDSLQPHTAGAMHFKNAVTQESDLPSSPTVGDVYVSTANFTYNNEPVEPGDLFIYTSVGWTVVQGNIDTSMIPTKVSDLTNDSGFITDSDLDSIEDEEINSLFNS